MAEQYEPGEQRIYYRASNYGIDLVVKVYFVDPDLKKSDEFILTEVDKELGGNDFPGLYYFMYTFYVGNYVAYFYEEGTGRRFVQAYSIRWASGEAVSIDHDTEKIVIERKGDPTLPFERGSNPGGGVERGH